MEAGTVTAALPVELQAMVLSSLPLPSVLSAALSCRAWHALVFTLWKTLYTMLSKLYLLMFNCR